MLNLTSSIKNKYLVIRHLNQNLTHRHICVVNVIIIFGIGNDISSEEIELYLTLALFNR